MFDHVWHIHIDNCDNYNYNYNYNYTITITFVRPPTIDADWYSNNVNQILYFVGAYLRSFSGHIYVGDGTMVMSWSIRSKLVFERFSTSWAHYCLNTYSRLQISGKLNKKSFSPIDDIVRVGFP